jgi:hypothetical protein
MADNTIYTSQEFLKDFDPYLRNFLVAVDRIEKEILRLDMAVADMKEGYVAFTKSLKQDLVKE